MIVVEYRLRDVFAFLNEISGFKPIFKYGDVKELNAFLRSQVGKNKTPYPLVWLVMPYDEEHRNNYVEVSRVSLVLSVKTTSAMLNDERFAKTYDKILFPLVDDIKRVLKKSNITFVKDEEFVIRKFPNYTDEDLHETTDVWDSIRMTFDLQISNNCLKLQ